MMSTGQPEATTQPGEATADRGGSALRNFLPTLVFSVAAPIITMNVAHAHGMSDLKAYLLASIGPLVQTVGEFVIRREKDMVSLFFLTMTLGSALITVVGNTSSIWLLLKDSAITGVFALVCLGSLVVMPRPLMYYFALKSAGGPTSPKGSQFEQWWPTVPSFRRAFQVITAVWGIGFVVEALIKVIVAETYSFETAYELNQVLPLVVAGVLGVFTAIYAKKMRERGEAMRAARLQREAAAPPA